MSDRTEEGFALFHPERRLILRFTDQTEWGVWSEVQEAWGYSRPDLLALGYRVVRVTLTYEVKK